MRGNSVLSTLLVLAGLAEVVIYLVNYSNLKSGGANALIPFDGIGAVLGYPGISVNEVQVTADYAQTSAAYAPQEIANAASSGDQGAEELEQEDEDAGLDGLR